MLDKTFDPAAIEQRLYKQWEDSGKFSCAPEGNAAPFAVMMPPPNVTGSLHMGHALNMTLQDILTRYWRMKGRDALWQPGTDHAGIATQMVVERQLEAKGEKRREMGRDAFLERVWAWKAESGGTIVRQLRRLGATPDWGRERFTMDDGLSRAVRKVFVRLHKEGLIYRDKRLVNWDPKLRTAVSDLEVEQREVKGHLWHIRYPVQGESERFITVATTRPETMLGDTAVAVHPDDARYKDLVGQFAILPIVGRPIRIVADTHADPEKGSGAVKITPAHDFNDFEVGRRHDLPVVNILDENACLNANTPEDYRGLDRFEARKKILQELESLGLVEKVEDIVHAVPYDEKSKSVVLEPFLTDQWYVDAKTLAGPAIAAVREGKTAFVPKSWENTYYNWMENIQPWCISRQLWWGHRIPAWYGPDGHAFVEETQEDAQKAADAHYGEKTRITQDPDVLDTWFSSALWPFSTLGWPDETPALRKYYPGDTLITGFDIIFFWVARMMMMGIHFMGEVPFRTVYIHALVRDAKGQKMSKSKGNVVDPLDLMDKYGTDALRFCLTAMAAQGRDVRLSEERVEGYRNFATKLWNAARYAEMNGCTLDPRFAPLKVEGAVNRWIVSEVAATAEKVGQALETYRFNEAAGALYQFVWGTFCDWYLEFTKPILTRGTEDPATIETRKTTAWVLEQSLILLNPFMPFVTEALRQGRSGESAAPIFSGSWPEYGPDYRASDASAEMDWLIRLIGTIRSVRADMNVPAGAKIPLLVRGASQETTGRLADHEEIVQRLARIESIARVDEAPKGAIQVVLDEAMLLLPVAGVIDLERERSRLKKEIERLSKDIEKIDAKLANAQFVANAPEEVIEEQKTRKAEAEGTVSKLSGALEQLESAA